MKDEKILLNPSISGCELVFESKTFIKNSALLLVLDEDFILNANDLSSSPFLFDGGRKK